MMFTLNNLIICVNEDDFMCKSYLHRLLWNIIRDGYNASEPLMQCKDQTVQKAIDEFMVDRDGVKLLKFWKCYTADAIANKIHNYDGYVSISNDEI